MKISLGVFSKESIYCRDTCFCMFTAVLFIITSKQKQHRCPTTDKWMRMSYIFTMEFISVKQNEVVRFTGKQMKL